MAAESLRSMNNPDIKEVKEFPALSPSEDFAYYAEKFPACFFYIACTPKGVEKPYFNHHPKFDIDEDALLVAAKAVGQVVCSYYELN
jgi:metal-dependent amidase/aminoacylase/carboxypeptidase family protein